ncbi:unnamed protein product [Lactuca saligna]|uniref:Uncharacterized protein n=1 Tax=Lactuca saligna TaxID=75948 RepID=A0AA35YPL9_LACSI|nr:unnamed protein product [Lactuca saligna]
MIPALIPIDETRNQSSSASLHRVLLASFPCTPTAATDSSPFVDIDQGNRNAIFHSLLLIETFKYIHIYITPSTIETLTPVVPQLYALHYLGSELTCFLCPLSSSQNGINSRAFFTKSHPVSSFHTMARTLNNGGDLDESLLTSSATSYLPHLIGESNSPLPYSNSIGLTSLTFTNWNHHISHSMLKLSENP